MALDYLERIPMAALRYFCGRYLENNEPIKPSESRVEYQRQAWGSVQGLVLANTCA